MRAQDDPAAEAVALFNEAQDVHAKGDLTAALAIYEKALKLVPEFPEAEYQKGHALLSLGRLDEAETAFRRAVELREDWSLGLAALGSVLITRGKTADAEPVLLKALEIDALNFPAFVSLVELRLVANADAATLRQMLATATTLTTKANPPATLWTARASLERALGENAAAQLSIKKALEADPRSVAALSEAAHVALENNDPNRASVFVNRLESADPTSTNTKLLKARVLAGTGKLAEASAVLSSIATPTPAVTKLREALMVEMTTDPAEVEKQLAETPGSGPLLGKLCGLYRRKDPFRALDYCRRASEAEPNNIDHAIGFGAALVQAKRYEDAVMLLTKLSGLDANNSTIRANLATALFQLRRYEEAKKEFRWLLDDQPNLYTGYYFLAIVHDRLEEYPDAMANYQEFLKRADAVKDREEIDRVNLRLPALRKQLDSKKGSRK
ncbi:MAG: tetratricopeptide repeat protein [Pyrinomonadaceae bacterium]|nr:tetratricopeptide repeat protein [Pyrinomonadaceae bacterium]